MNTQKIDCQERIQQTHGLIGDFDSEFANPSSQYLGNQQPWNMGIRMQPQLEGGTQQQSFGPAKPSSTIIDRFESPASAFYATERYMGFPQYECQVGNPTCGSQYSGSNDSQFSSYQSSGENFESVEQAEPNFELRNSLQSIVKTQFCGNQFYRSSEKSNKIPCSNFPGSKLPLHEQNKLLGDNGSPVGGHFSIPNVENQDHRASYNSYSSPLAQMRFSSLQEKQSPRFSPGGVSVSPGNPISPGPILSSKTRIRWNQDLHEKFVECINRLGGAEKATPKAILKLMDSDGLTIFHVKSHLQKYRIAKYMPDSTEGKAEKRTSINYVPQTDEKNGLHIREALQLQLDVQRSLHEQLEIQRNLQLRIEEQGRQLKMMFDQQQQNTNSLLQSHQNLDITPPDDQPFSIEDVGVSIAEGSDNTHFPSKIS